MKRRSWIACSIGFASLGAASLAPRAARACAGGDDGGEVTTFDPHVIDDASEEPLFYDPDTKGVGHGPCDSCAVGEMRADWAAFLGPGVTRDDWSKILLSAPLPDIDALILTLQGKTAKPPRAYEQNTVLKVPAGADRDKVIAALYFVGFARRVEPYAAAPSVWGEPRPTPRGDPAALQANGESAFGRAKLPFLRQRYAFQLLRLRFYRDDWKGVVSFHDKQRKALEGPSDNLKWRARYYVAGALNRDGELAKANILLARIHSGSASLAAAAALDFQPMEDADWKETLALARSAKEKVELWRLVGLKLDAVEASRKIVALDPRSKRVALLAVRELNKAEYQGNAAALADIAALARQLADRPTTDRRWLFDLVAGHAAALSGDLKAARPRLERVIKARPGTLAETQAWASLALALAHAWKATGPDKKAGEELASAMGKVRIDFSRGANVQQTVRQLLADAYRTTGKCVEARLFGSEDCSVPWSDPKFVEAMIARVSSTPTAFDRFMVEGSGYEPRGLVRELALLHLAKGDLDRARRILQQPKDVAPSPLGTDPFAVHIRDCYQCDRAAFAGSKWTDANLIARLIELRALAQRPGEAGAAAAFQLGSAYYNISAFGNARHFTDGTHVAFQPGQAEGWYKAAYETSRDRDFKVKAAFMAAKSELARRVSEPRKGPPGPIDPADYLPIPTTWFPVVKSFADTAYHREILRECGHYRRWAKRN